MARRGKTTRSKQTVQVHARVVDRILVLVVPDVTTFQRIVQKAGVPSWLLQKKVRGIYLVEVDVAVQVLRDLTEHGARACFECGKRLSCAVWTRAVPDVEASSIDPRLVASARELGLTLPTTRQAVVEAHRAATLQRHPDRGGNHEAMVAANVARDALLASIA